MSAPLHLTQDMVIVLGLVSVSAVLLMFERIRNDAAALAVLVVLGLTGIVPAQQLFGGFSGHAVMSIMATMILGAGLDRTGALGHLAGWLLRTSRGMEDRLVIMTSAIAGAISGFMQNPSVMALFVPVASRLSTRTGLPLSQLLLPIAFAIVLGGSLTMVGSSPLILLNDLLRSADVPGADASLHALPLFAPMPVGALLLLAGLLYYRYFSKARLRGAADKGVAPGSTERYFAQTYGLDGDLFELTVTAESPLVGMTVGDAESQRDAPFFLALRSEDESRVSPPADQRLWVGSVIGVMGRREAIQDYAQRHQLRFSARLRHFNELFDPGRAGISEAVIPPTSRFIGRRPSELRLRKTFGINLLAVNRAGHIHREDARQVPLRAGDLLVFHGVWSDLAQAGESRDFVVVTDYPKEEHRPHKLWWALGAFVTAMGLALTNLVPVPVALMGGAAAMVLSGVINMDEAYGSINWKTVFLMACLIPLGWAMDSTGAANWVAQHTLAGIEGRVPIWLLQALIGLLTMGFGLVIGNVGATVVMVPMAISLAETANGEPVAFAMIAALSASNNFVSHSNPVLSMVSAPAGYDRAAFWQHGLPMSFLYLGIVLLAVNLMY
jgi:di/tricarboxylate transporter